MPSPTFFDFAQSKPSPVRSMQVTFAFASQGEAPIGSQPDVQWRTFLEMTEPFGRCASMHEPFTVNGV